MLCFLSLRLGFEQDFQIICSQLTIITGVYWREDRLKQKIDMDIKVGQIATDSPKAEVGEIDTRAPFESVKAAVSMFGEGAFSGEKIAIRKSRPFPTERVLAKDTQLHLAQKELNKFKEQLKNAETMKAQALSELEMAKHTVDDLNHKLNTINKAKESAMKVTEEAKNQAKEREEANSGGSGGVWEEGLNSARERYAAAISELDATKQELRIMRQDFEASMEAKIAAFGKVAAEEHASMANRERAGELSKEIVIAQEALGHVKLNISKAEQDHAKVIAEKDADRVSYRDALKEAEMKLSSLRKEFDPEVMRKLEMKLAETGTEIGVLQKEMENAKASDLVYAKSVTSELNGAKEALQKVAEEERSLRSLMESLKIELDSVKKEHAKLKDREAETESVAGNLHVKLRKSKDELEAAFGEESKAKGASDELIATLQQLSSETENARNEAELMKRTAEELKIEAEATRISLQEAEKKLEVAFREAEEAKMAEKKALDRIKLLSERTNAARASTSESGTKITVSREEFDSLCRKVEESNKLTEMKVAAAMAQVEAVKASEHEALKRLETTRKEIEEMKEATEKAIKMAGMAEAAKRAVEGELCKWREREEKKAAEVASRILAEAAHVSSETSSPLHARVSKQNSPDSKTERVQRMEKKPASKKVILPNLSDIFNRKKNQVEGGSPSYLPGEKPL